METMTASEIMDIMEELGICVDSFTDDIYIPTLEELCRMFGVNSLEELRNMPHGHGLNKRAHGLYPPILSASAMYLRTALWKLV